MARVARGKGIQIEVASFEEWDPAGGTFDLVTAGSADDWVAMLATFSDHQRLGRERLSRLQDALRAAIKNAGGVVQSMCGKYVWSARRA